MQSLRLGDFTVDPAAGRMIGPAGIEQLDPKVMQVLVVLAKHAVRSFPAMNCCRRSGPGWWSVTTSCRAASTSCVGTCGRPEAMNATRPWSKRCPSVVTG